jgi:hypothetical protein
MALVRKAREDAVACRQADRGGEGQDQYQRALKVCRHVRLGEVVKEPEQRLAIFSGEAQRRGPSGHRARALRT